MASASMTSPAGISTVEPIQIMPLTPRRPVRRLDRKLPTRKPSGGSAA